MAEEQAEGNGGQGNGGQGNGGQGNGGQGNGGQGNGGPVHPGEPPHAVGPGTGSNGRAGGRSTAEAQAPVGRGRIGGVWVVLTLSAVVLVFLLVFIVQNNVDIPIKFLGAQGTLPSGVALLFAAALGILLAAIPGYGRILQLRRALTKRQRH